MKKRISEEIKQRQWFRPLACILREETFAKHFPGELPSPYMLFPYAMPKGIAPEVTHADGTCRIQTIGASDHPLLNELLEAWEQQTGEIGLINTSLNSRGNAIAYTVEDAIADLQPRGVTRFVANEWIST
jgi:carbamoyltransferase